MITFQRYDRYWAVFHEGELLAVVVYKKGALAIKSLIEQLGGPKEDLDITGLPEEINRAIPR